MRLTTLLAGILCVILFTVDSEAVAGVGTSVYSESVFAPWDNFGFYGPGGVFVGSRAIGGNPGGYFGIRMNVFTDRHPSVTLFIVGRSAIYSPAGSGPIAEINYSQDVKYLLGPSSGTETGLALLQGGTYFVCREFAPNQNLWLTQSKAGLRANDFVALTESGFEPGWHPNFSANGPDLKLGIYHRITTLPAGESYTVEHGLDNWRVEVVSIPEPAAFVVAASGLLGWSQIRRCRKVCASDRGSGVRRCDATLPG